LLNGDPIFRTVLSICIDQTGTQIMHIFRKAAFISALLSTSAAFGASPSWTISESSGAVAVSHVGANKIAFSRSALKGASVIEGDVISTGANGRTVLVRGEEYVIVAPNSRLRLVDTTEVNTFTQFFQSMGNSVFKIKKKSTPHFGVQTPYLAAVVKGTTFSVTVTPTGAAVQVTEGRVEVSTLDGAATHLVIPGEIGMISEGTPYRLTIQGNAPQVIESPNHEIKPIAETSPTSEAPKAAAQALAAEAPVPAPVAEPSRFEGAVTSAISEGPVQLETVTGGLISGNSTLVAAITASETRTAMASNPANPVEIEPIEVAEAMPVTPVVPSGGALTLAGDDDQAEAPSSRPVTVAASVPPTVLASNSEPGGSSGNSGSNSNSGGNSGTETEGSGNGTSGSIITAPAATVVAAAPTPAAAVNPNNGGISIAFSGGGAPIVTQTATSGLTLIGASGNGINISAAGVTALNGNSGSSGNSGNSGSSNNGNSGSNSGTGNSGNGNGITGPGNNGNSGSNGNSGGNGGSGNGNGGSNNSGKN
jgi:FecR protein